MREANDASTSNADHCAHAMLCCTLCMSPTRFLLRQLSDAARIGELVLTTKHGEAVLLDPLLNKERVSSWTVQLLPHLSLIPPSDLEAAQPLCSLTL